MQAKLQTAAGSQHLSRFCGILDQILLRYGKDVLPLNLGCRRMALRSFFQCVFRGVTGFSRSRASRAAKTRNGLRSGQGGGTLRE